MAERQRLAPFLSTIVALLLPVALLNAWVDLSGLGTDSRHVLELARRQRDGEVLVSERDYDQRAWVKARLASGGCPGFLLTGSSTAGMFRASMLPGTTFLNAWLTGPSVEDFEAITTMLARADCTPRRIALGVDPFLFNPLVTDQRWLTVRAERAAFRSDGSAVAAAQGAVFAWQGFKERLTFSSTRDSLRFLLARGSTAPSLPELQSDPPESFCAGARRAPLIRHSDGHFSSCPRFDPSTKEAEDIAIAYVERDSHRIRSWPRVDEERMRRLFTVVQAWRKRGSEVIVFAPPYHPSAYQQLLKTGSVRRLLEQMDGLLATHAGAAGVRWVNLRDPAIAGCPPEEFLDSHHMRAGCAQKVVRVLNGD
jgi:hypothetical protein